MIHIKNHKRRSGPLWKSSMKGEVIVNFCNREIPIAEVDHSYKSTNTYPKGEVIVNFCNMEIPIVEVGHSYKSINTYISFL